ncbi:hypothetical protein IWQ61_007490 [Dispira simplex]|nr:hypothetical protein IWQ61_007490 [Dispira simplex]
MAADATTKPGGVGPVKLKKMASKVKRTKENGQDEETGSSSNSSGTASPNGEQTDSTVHLHSTTSFPDLSASADTTHPAQDILPPVTSDQVVQETTDFPKPFAEVANELNRPTPVAPNTPSDSTQLEVPATNPSVSINDPEEFPPVQINRDLEHSTGLPSVPVEPAVEFEKSFADVAKDEPHTPSLAPALKAESSRSRNLASSGSAQAVPLQEKSKSRDELIPSEAKEESRESRPTPIDTPFKKLVPTPSKADSPSITSSSCFAYAVVRRGWILGIIGGILAVLLRHRNPPAARSAGTVGICITSLYGLRWVYNKFTRRS